MPFEPLDRRRIRMRPLAGRENRVRIERDAVHPDQAPGELPDAVRRTVAETAGRIAAARRTDRPVMMAFGAHAIKNGLAPVLIHMMERGWLTHLATNGAGIIHDWEFAFQGESSEHVERNVAAGTFGAWEETGFYLNLALLVGAYRGLGYGESVGAMIESEALEIPQREQLLCEVRRALDQAPLRALHQILLGLGPAGCRSSKARAPVRSSGSTNGHPSSSKTDSSVGHRISAGAQRAGSSTSAVTSPSRSTSTPP